MLVQPCYRKNWAGEVPGCLVKRPGAVIAGMGDAVSIEGAAVVGGQGAVVVLAAVAAGCCRCWSD